MNPTSAAPAATGARGSLAAPAGTTLALIVALAIALFSVPLGWGIDGKKSLAVDEMPPAEIERARRLGFAGGWSHYYPPMLVYVTALVAEVAGIEGSAPEGQARLRLATRFVSLAAAASTVLLVALVGLRLGLGSGAYAAGAIWVASPVVAYYAKTANVDSLYLFFLALALLLLLRYRESWRLRDLAAAAVAAACAAATKDQAAVYFALLPAVLMLPAPAAGAAPDSPPPSDRPRRLGHAVIAGGVGLAAYALALNLPANLDGVREHFERLRRVSRTAPEFAASLAGKTAQAGQIAADLAFVVGAAAVLLAAIGAARLAARAERRRAHAPHLLLAAGYLAFFWLAVPRSYDRFTLPAAISLAFLAGEGWDAALEWGRRRLPRLHRPLLALLLAVSLARAVELDLRLLFDARAQVGDWIERDGGTRRTTVVVPHFEWLPTYGERLWLRPPHRVGRWLAARRPAHVVGESTLLDQRGWRHMLIGSGYREAWRSSGPIRARLSHPRAARSNLDKIGRELVVWRRAADPEAVP